MKKLQTTLDKITTLISAILCAAMMVILFANVVLRLIPGIGDFGAAAVSLFIVNEDCGNLTAVNGSLLFNKNFTAVINQRAHRIAVNIYPYIFILF